MVIKATLGNGWCAMLNEERIRLMAKMASYEEGEGKEYIPIKQYYRKDYISYQGVKTFFSSTICFGILLLFRIVYGMEDITELLGSKVLSSIGVSLLLEYLAFIAIYQAIAYIVYSRRYAKATAGTKEYCSILKKVQKLQEKEEKAQPSEDWK